MEMRSLIVPVWFLLLSVVVSGQNASEPFVPPQPQPAVSDNNSSMPANGSSPTNGTSVLFPLCARDCITTGVFESLSACQTVDNTTCVCNDSGFYKVIETCILAGCTPPEGIATQRAKADYCHDPARSQVTMLYGLRILEIAAWLLVLFRFYARWVTQLCFGWDDYTMMAVAVIYVPQLIISQLMDDAAFGRDIWDVDWDKIILGLKLFFVQEPLYVLQLGLTKISILFLYLRIFPGRRFKIVTYTCMAFVAGSTLTLVGGSIMECLPVGYFWEAWNQEYLIHTTKCINLTVAVFLAAGLSILQDIIMIILPIPPLLQTSLPRKNKIGIATMFILGLLITGASCFRLQFVNVAYSPNPFWDFEPALLWSLVELAMSFLVTSLPAMRNYYTRIIRPRVRAFVVSRRETKASSGSRGSGPSGRSLSQSLSRSRMQDGYAARAPRRGGSSNNNNNSNNNNEYDDTDDVASALALKPMSWKSVTDRDGVWTREGLPSPVHTDKGRGGIISTKAPQISLWEIGMSPDLEINLEEEVRSSSYLHEPRDYSIRDERDAVHALAWGGRARHEARRTDSREEKTISSSNAQSRHGDQDWPLRTSDV